MQLPKPSTYNTIKKALFYIKTLQEFKQTGERLWQENPPTHDPDDPSYFIPNESASHKFIDPEEPKKTRKSQGKRKVNKDNAAVANKKRRTHPTSATADKCTTPVQPVTTETCPTAVQPVTMETCPTAVQPGTTETCPTPVAPATAVTPTTPTTQKGKGKAQHQKHHLLLLLILMIMDHLSQMQLRKHCWKLKLQILLCTTTEYKVATITNVDINEILCL